MKVNDEQIRKLKPYIAGEVPDDRGETNMYCPLHNDGKRSAQVNLERGVWFCHAGCGGGSVRMLIDNEDAWVPLEGRGVVNRSSNGNGRTKEREKVTEHQVEIWHQNLLTNAQALSDLYDARGIVTETVERYQLGWDAGRQVYTIPIRGRRTKLHKRGKLLNLRRYDMAPKEGRRKIWGIRGRNDPRLYPRDVATGDGAVVICEGEWDALLTNQHGVPAITRTGAAKVWKEEWSGFFKDRIVYLCHDCDEAGMAGNRIVYEALKDIASEVRFLRLPYPIVEKHGKDLTDFLLDHEEHATSELLARMDDAPLWDPARHEPTSIDPDEASVLDAFDSRRVGDAMRLTVTIKGKREPGYSVPRHVHYHCSQDAGTKCQICPLNQVGGDARHEFDPGSELILDMVDAPKLGLQNTLREAMEIPKCNRLHIDVKDHQAVEVLFARPSVDHVRSEDAADYKNMKIMSCGRHDTFPNNTVQVTGALYPSPRSQGNEFLAWDVQRQETSLDNFTLDGEAIQMMRKFQSGDDAPIDKLFKIAKAMETHVTHIYGRPELHMAMDLVYHSVLAFDFAGSRIERGWLELLVAGDTRTGKSEVATRLARHYKAGEVVSCESATYAGIIGGLQQYGASKEWSVTWGAVPINDRRLVILDEIGGLSPDEIAAMSSVRSSGVAELTKIQSERTFARTRLIWLGNPRNGRMSDYTYGAQAIRPLIGNPEDIARFDLAMSASAGEVPMETINRYARGGRLIYDSDSCAALVRWAWSRRPEHIQWAPGAEDAVLRLAGTLGKRYVEDPPLVQAANIRVKIARLAVALATRTFSTDDEAEVVIVRDEHVVDVVRLLETLYRLLGYRDLSRELLSDELTARDNALRIEVFLEDRAGLAAFLRSTPVFRGGDLEAFLNISRDEANAIISTLWESRMVRKDRGDVRVAPALQTILREIR